MGELANLHLRGYHARDLEAMFALDCLCFEPPFRFSRRAMRQFAQAGNSVVQLAFAAGAGAGGAAASPGTGAEHPMAEQLLGFCIVHLEPAGDGLVGYVVTLDVAPAVRRQGLAGVLMRSVEAAAATAGADEMTLHVFSANAGAVRLYEQFGYRAAGIAENFYGRGLHAIVYRKPL